MHGFPGHALLDAIAHDEATLVAVGPHGQRRSEGIPLGSTATLLLHDAPASILLTREATAMPPRRIVVGVDGSLESAAAYSAARYLAGRFDGDLTVVIAGGREPDRPGSRLPHRR